MLLHKADDTITESVREYSSGTNLPRNIQSSNTLLPEDSNEQNDEILVDDDIDINFPILKKCLEPELNDQNEKKMKDTDRNDQDNA